MNKNLFVLNQLVDDLLKEADKRLTNDEPFINWFNGQVQNITDLIQRNNNYQITTGEDKAIALAIETNSKKLLHLLNQYEVEFRRFDILENLLTDIVRGNTIII